MSNRWKLWLGASALAMASGALPAAPILSPVTSELLGIDLADDAQAKARKAAPSAPNRRAKRVKAKAAEPRTITHRVLPLGRPLAALSFDHDANPSRARHFSFAAFD
jgi:hypothetical protein